MGTPVANTRSSSGTVTVGAAIVGAALMLLAGAGFYYRKSVINGAGERAEADPATNLPSAGFAAVDPFEAASAAVTEVRAGGAVEMM